MDLDLLKEIEKSIEQRIGEKEFKTFENKGHFSKRSDTLFEIYNRRKEIAEEFTGNKLIGIENVLDGLKKSGSDEVYLFMYESPNFHLGVFVNKKDKSILGSLKIGINKVGASNRANSR